MEEEKNEEKEQEEKEEEEEDDIESINIENNEVKVSTTMDEREQKKEQEEDGKDPPLQQEEEESKKEEPEQQVEQEGKQEEKEEEAEKEENPRDDSTDDRERIFADVFYCPKTGEIMNDPVVHPDGTSFERSAVDSDTDVVYYPNRALQAIIHYEIKLQTVPLQRTLDSTRRLFRELVQKPNVSPRQEVLPLPEQYYCSITFDIMKNPVIDPDGHTFDRRAIVNWIKVNGNSPTTRNPLTRKQLYKNIAIKTLIDEEVGRDENLVHPYIRQFKEERGEEESDDEDLEEGDSTHDTPTSFIEIEELRRQNRREEWNFRFCFIMLLIVLGFVYFPYTTILIVGISMLVLCGIREAQRSQG